MRATERSVAVMEEISVLLSISSEINAYVNIIKKVDTEDVSDADFGASAGILAPIFKVHRFLLISSVGL